MKLASIILDIPTQALDAPYTYLVSDDVVDDGMEVQVGCACLVPFGGRQAIGFIVDVRDSDEPGAFASLDVSGSSRLRLKPIIRVLSQPYFDEEGAACAQYLAKRYIAPLSACIRLFTPPGGVPRIVRSRTGEWRL